MPLPRVLLVNLPHRRRIQRRYVASYEAPNFLIPPVELMGLHALLGERAAADVRLIDAIAEDLSEVGIRSHLGGWRPQLIVALTGFDVLDDDLRSLGRLRSLLRGPMSAVFGYLPSRRPAEALAHPGVDFVLLDEPEHALVPLCAAIDPDSVEPPSSARLAPIEGLAFDLGSGPVINPAPALPVDLDSLPFPDHGVVRLDRYGESFLRGPIGVVQSARGCPYPCTFCCRAWGSRVRYRSAGSLAHELQALYRSGLRRVRFLDDTFTLDRGRVETLCHEIRCAMPGLRWSCLTRLDRIDARLATLMAEAGCDRMYVGIESGTPWRLDAWRKGLDRDLVERGVAVVKAAGIECCGFFITGAPEEDLHEARRNATWAAEMGLDWVIVTRLQQHQGSESTAPNDEEREDGFALERAFYRRFYLRPTWLREKLPLLVRSPADVLRGAVELGRYLVGAVGRRDFI